MFWFHILYFAKKQVETRTIAESLDDFDTQLEINNLNAAGNIIENLYKTQKDNQIVTKKYSDFLVKIGEYKKALSIKNLDPKIRLKIKDLDEKSENIIRYFKHLSSNSPFSLKIRIQKIKLLLDQNLEKCDKYISQTESLYKSNDKIQNLKAIYYAYKLQHENAFYQLLKVNSAFAKPYKKFFMLLDKYRNQKYFEYNDAKKLVDSLNASHKKAGKPSIFKHLLVQTLIFFIKNAVDLQKHVSSYSKILIGLYLSDYTLYLHSKALIVENDIEEAKIYMNEISNASYKRVLQKAIQYALDKKKEEEAEKKKQNKDQYYNQKKQQNSNKQYGNQADSGQQFRQTENKDPLGYYKIIGVDTNASPKLIKKKYLRRVLEVDPDKSKKKLTEKEKEQGITELQKINAARDVLLSPEKRKQYDAGLLDQQKNGQRNAEANEQIQQMIDAFFGGGQRQNGQSYHYSTGGGNQGGYRRQQTFFFV